MGIVQVGQGELGVKGAVSTRSAGARPQIVRLYARFRNITGATTKKRGG